MPTIVETPFRLVFGLLVVTALTLSSLYRRKARRISGTIPRSREGGAFLLGRLAAGLLLLLGILAYALNPQWMAWSRLALPEWLRWSGAAGGIVALMWLNWTFRTIGGNISETFLTKEGHQLVTDGPYRRVRHPLYTGAIALSAGLGLLAANGWILATTSLALVAIAVVVVPREEAELVARFGQDYRNYRRRTGGFAPRLGRRA